MIEAVLGHITWVASGLLIAIALFWVVARSNSLFDVRYRLWRLARSGNDIFDDGLRQALRDHADLATFRTLFMRADTLGEMRRLLEYAEKNGLEPGILGDCGRYFHRREMVVRESVPSLSKTKAICLCARLLLVIPITMASYLGFQDRALLSFNDDHTWFWLSQDMAQAYGSRQAVLLPNECPATAQSQAGLSAAHVAVLCSSHGSKRFMTSIQDGIQEQRWTAGVLLVLCAAAYGWLWRHLRSVRAAHAVRNWLQLRALETTAA